MKILFRFIDLFLITAVICIPIHSVQSQGSTAIITIRDKDDRSISRLTDGDGIKLRLEQPLAAGRNTQITFQLKGAEAILAECTIPQGKTVCETEIFAGLGWYWDQEGLPKAIREITASAEGVLIATSSPVNVAPRPVVMIHGFSSSWEAWASYLSPFGYLAKMGIPGYAVGDGQVPGLMNTGRLDQPTGRTNTIAENAAILGEYIRGVQKATGAQKVDLLAHSMGGLISRYYIDRIMEDEAAQLIMLGSPMAGTECANLPASLNFYLPAALEIQPIYVTGIFNPQITHRKGVAFHALAGVPIKNPVQSPCTAVPTDLAVAFDSVGAIPLDLSQTPVLHTELNTSEQVFREYVLPLLQTPAGGFPVDEPDPAPLDNNTQPLQFSRIYTGHIQPGETQEVTINIEPEISVASFALYDSSRSLETIVRGASGNIIQLDPVANGLIRVEDPSTMVYLGYGFENPRPGAWVITLVATDQTPHGGADYSLTAVFQGGAELQTQTSLLLPAQNEPVQLTSRLLLGGQGLAIERARAIVRLPDGSIQEIPLENSGDQVTGTWIPGIPGLSAIQVEIQGRGPEDLPIDRTAFLVVEAQPQRNFAGRSLALIGGIVALVCGGALALVLLGFRMFRKSKQRQ